MKKIFTIAFVLLASTQLYLFNYPLAHAQQSDENAPKIEVYLTNQVQNNQPSRTEKMEQFGCSDRIYAVMQATNLPREKHEFSVHWFDPTDKQMEVTRFDFNGAYKNRLWSWLQLHAPTGAILGQMFDPSFGMEGFIGQWRVEYKINDEKVAEQLFQVMC